MIIIDKGIIKIYEFYHIFIIILYYKKIILLYLCNLCTCKHKK